MTDASSLVQGHETGAWDKTGTTAVCGASIYHAEIGDGLPVVLLHKMGGWGADWRNAAPLLAQKGYRAIAFDLLGQGRTKMCGEVVYVINIEEHAVAVAAALEDMGIMSFHIAGCSLGGDVAVVMAALYPERVRSIAAWSMSMGPPMSVDGLRARDAAGFYKGFDENEVALPQTIDDVAPGWFIDRERIHEQNASRKMAGPWMKPVSRGISRCNFPAYMPRVKCPMVITYGEQRHFGEFAEEVLAKVKGSRQVTLPGAVSFMHEDQPRMLVDMIADHFAAADKALS